VVKLFCLVEGVIVEEEYLGNRVEGQGDKDLKVEQESQGEIGEEGFSSAAKGVGIEGKEVEYRVKEWDVVLEGKGVL